MSFHRGGLGGFLDACAEYWHEKALALRFERKVARQNAREERAKQEQTTLDARIRTILGERTAERPASQMGTPVDIPSAGSATQAPSSSVHPNDVPPWASPPLSSQASPNQTSSPDNHANGAGSPNPFSDLEQTVHSFNEEADAFIRELGGKLPGEPAPGHSAVGDSPPGLSGGSTAPFAPPKRPIPANSFRERVRNALRKIAPDVPWIVEETGDIIVVMSPKNREREQLNEDALALQDTFGVPVRNPHLIIMPSSRNMLIEQAETRVEVKFRELQSFVERESSSPSEFEIAMKDIFAKKTLDERWDALVAIADNLKRRNEAAQAAAVNAEEHPPGDSPADNEGSVLQEKDGASSTSEISLSAP